MQRLLIALVALVRLVLCDMFESSDFDVAHALYSQGLDTTSLQRMPTPKNQSSCSNACSSLLSHYGSDYVLTPNGTAYTAFREGYWSSVQTDPFPQCVFEPPDAHAVAMLVLISRMTNCPFAVKSGGHAAFAGASSIEGGITVSLQNLNSVELSADKKIAYVEPGNSWVQVYSKLAEYELAVVGGRVARIGVGGLTLGGGISFFSGFHGWACDNVEAYEIVTACGKLVTVSSEQHADLYWALRGGGNNFGIVTKFHLRTVPVPGNIIWGGTRTYLPTEYPSLIQAFTNLGLNAELDPRAGQWAAFYRHNGMDACAATLWYDNPANITTTKIFSNYSSLRSVADSTRDRNLVEFVTENQESNPYGLREVYWTITTKASAELASFAIDMFYSDLPLLSEVPGAFSALLLQTITVPQIVNMAQNGGNPLGLNPNDGPLFLLSVPTQWQSAADDDTIYTFLSGIMRKISDKAKQMCLQNDYIYMNYASPFQNVIRGYGPINQARLIKTARKYDPDGVFQVLQPGYFKLNGPPVKSDYFSGS